MSSFILLESFASQSEKLQPLFVTAAHRHAGGVTLLVHGSRYPQTGRVRIGGLVPGRHYLLDGAAHRFVRTDPDGVACIDVRIAAPTLVIVAPVL